MSVALAKYAPLFYRLDALNGLNTAEASCSYLIEGEDDDGLSLLARLLAARLAGIPDERATDDFADIVVYPTPEKAKTKKEEGKRVAMTVDDVKELIGSLYLTPFELNKKFYIIEHAETMSEILQNKLLKSLEEPPPRVCFILCASRSLLPTVESRCKTLRLPPLPIDTVETELGRFHKDYAAVKLAARASRGNIGMAEKILADKDFGATYLAALKLLKTATGSKNFSSVAAVYDKFTRDKIDSVLGIIEYLLADISRSLVGMPTVFDENDIRSVSGGFTPYSAAACTEHVRDAVRRNSLNCMPTAVMDTLMLKIMEEKAKCQRS